MDLKYITVKGNAFRCTLETDTKRIRLDYPLEYIVDGYFLIAKSSNEKYRIIKMYPTSTPIKVPFGDNMKVYFEDN